MARTKRKSTRLHKFLVVGYDADQQQTTGDYILAKDRSEAHANVFDARDKAHDLFFVVDVLSVRDLRRQYETLRNLTNRKVEEGWTETLRELNPTRSFTTE